MSLPTLPDDQYVFLAYHYAAESNLSALRSIALSRPNVFDAVLLLRILLTFLPESTDPQVYVHFVEDVVNGSLTKDQNARPIEMLLADESRQDIGNKSMRQKPLLPLVHPSCPPSESPLVRFLVSRAYQLDRAGLLILVTPLLKPFVHSSEYLRVWFISNTLPLLRYGYDFYPEEQSTISLEQSESCGVKAAVQIWLHRTLEEDLPLENRNLAKGDHHGSPSDNLARNLRCIMGPWMYGSKQRKEKQHFGRPKRSSGTVANLQKGQPAEIATRHGAESANDWDEVFKWLIRVATDQFPFVAKALCNWDGPSDVDLGGFFGTARILGSNQQETSPENYIQTMFSSIYAATTNSPETVAYAQDVLVRIAQLMRLEPPADLRMDVERLPRVDTHDFVGLEITTSMLDPDYLLNPGHPLTKPTPKAFLLLQMIVYSTYLLGEFGCRFSIPQSTKLKFHDNVDDQFNLLKKILSLSSTSAGSDERQWNDIRVRLLWLWDWSMPVNTLGNRHGFGVLGSVERAEVEKLILMSLLSAACYPAVINTYIRSKEHGLSPKDIEDAIIASALYHYDNASNGNRSRGGLKKASAIVSALGPYFSKSSRFREVESLLSATHSLSFYSLRLQHGVPFQPVNVRVSKDPVILIEKLLAQNPRSYTHLDDLVSIATNLIAASPLQYSHDTEGPTPMSPERLAMEQRQAEHRVIGMAVDAALREDDFETAYSYVLNRLDTSSASPDIDAGHTQAQDDVSWRAALTAGRYRPGGNASLSSSTSMSTPSLLRRVEQRTELLSQALLLAPSCALPEVLAAWRKCEEEMTVVAAKESKEEDEFDSHADMRLPGTFVKPTASSQNRREIGRGKTEEAPVGLFHLARGAAGALSKGAFPLKRNATDSPEQSHSPFAVTGSVELESTGRVRKRDIIADAATGALASGIGWVLGANPLRQDSA